MDTVYCILRESSSKPFDWFAFISIAIAFIIFLKGIYEYKKSQNWKRNEFIIKMIVDLENSYVYKNATLMLEWRDHPIELYPHETDVTKRYEKVSIDEQIIAIDINNDNRFDKKLNSVRFIFDRFFTQLGRIERYIENDLIKEKEVLPYLSYYLKILNAEVDYNEKEKFTGMVNKYLKEYNFKSTIKLLNRAKQRSKGLGFDKNEALITMYRQKLRR